VILIFARLALIALLLGSSAFTGGRSLLFATRRYLLAFSSLVVFGACFYYARLHFLAWGANEIMRAFVPPYNKDGIGYFLKFLFHELFNIYLISLATAVLLIFVLNYYNRKYDERFFYKEEVYFAATAIFIVGYPGIIYYLLGLLFLYLFLHIASLATQGAGGQISTYYMWLPLALLVILIVEYLPGYLPLYLLLKI